MPCICPLSSAAAFRMAAFLGLWSILPERAAARASSPARSPSAVAASSFFTLTAEINALPLLS